MRVGEGRGGAPSAWRLPSHRLLNPPGRQLTGTQAAKQMMDPTMRIRRDRGEARLQGRPPLNLSTRGQTQSSGSASSRACVRAHLR